MDLATLIDRQVASRLQRRDTTVFLPPDAPAGAHEAVRRRLGWVEAPATMRARLPEITEFAAGVAAEEPAEVVVLGMGGSGLCAEVVAAARPDPGARPRLILLDTTDEATVRRVTAALTPDRTLFLVASKSGSTIEVTSLERHFWAVASRTTGGAAGRRFAAITDPDTPLVSLAAARRYRHVFLNPADIGGRYSALSCFGLVPAALVGIDPATLLAEAAAMAADCARDHAGNPGLALGSFMAAQALAGRDKLSLLLPPPLAALGAWIEQLVAESTGKQGRGVLPVVGEPRGRFADYLPDRAFVVLRTAAQPPDPATLRRLTQAAHPVFEIDLSARGLGAEFYRWQVATAVAGAALGVNPFDEPDVRQAKVRTQALLDARRTSGDFRIEPPFERGPSYFRRHHLPAKAADKLPSGGGYLAILDFLPGEPWRAGWINALRQAVRRRSGVAATCGVGPRYLHSTGQYHKGGPNTGVFLLLTADDQVATPVPETDYTFSMLRRAQALGDFEALADAGRRVYHFHLDDHRADIMADVEEILAGLQQRRGDRRRAR